MAGSLTQPGYLGAPATYQPATANYNPATAQQIPQGLLNSISPQATIQQIQQAYLPQEQAATNNTNQTLADFGIGGGQAVMANQQVQGQLASSIAPALAQAIQQAQGMQLQGATTNAQLGTGVSENNSSNALQAAISNAAGANEAGRFGATAVNDTNAANVGQYNQRQQQMLQDIIDSYFAQLGAQTSITGQGQSAGNQNAINYGQTITTSDPFAAIFGGLGSIL